MIIIIIFFLNNNKTLFIDSNNNNNNNNNNNTRQRQIIYVITVQIQLGFQPVPGGSGSEDYQAAFSAALQLLKFFCICESFGFCRKKRAKRAQFFERLCSSSAKTLLVLNNSPADYAGRYVFCQASSLFFPLSLHFAPSPLFKHLQQIFNCF